MIAISHYMHDHGYTPETAPHTSVPGIWRKLRTLYDLETIDARVGMEPCYTDTVALISRAGGRHLRTGRRQSRSQEGRFPPILSATTRIRSQNVCEALRPGPLFVAILSRPTRSSCD